jgi:hypothetical protein
MAAKTKSARHTYSAAVRPARCVFRFVAQALAVGHVGDERSGGDKHEDAEQVE